MCVTFIVKPPGAQVKSKTYRLPFKEGQLLCNIITKYKTFPPPLLPILFHLQRRIAKFLGSGRAIKETERATFSFPLTHINRSQKVVGTDEKTFSKTSSIALSLKRLVLGGWVTRQTVTNLNNKLRKS